MNAPDLICRLRLEFLKYLLGFNFGCGTHGAERRRMDQGNGKIKFGQEQNRSDRNKNTPICEFSGGQDAGLA